MDSIEKNLLAEISDLHSVPEGAYNIRNNGKLEARNTTANIDIVTKKDKPGIDIYVKPGTKNESMHIPVILSESGLKDLVYNDFYIGEGADVTIIAGCGIHNCGDQTSQHDGIHTFYIGKNAKVKYVRAMREDTEYKLAKDSVRKRIDSIHSLLVDLKVYKGVCDTVGIAIHDNLPIQIEIFSARRDKLSKTLKTKINNL